MESCGAVWSRSWGKRSLDVVLATVLLLLALPVLAALALVVMLDSPGPPLFVQTRVGWHGRRFRMLKLRSMVVDAERRLPALRRRNPQQGPVFKLAGDPRITRCGRLLRRSSLDELPQLVNVLLGQMSLVGPRPLPPDQVDHHDPRFRRRTSVPPGMTGLWQISGRVMHVDYNRWLAMDCDYARRASLRLDLSILARTWVAVVRGHGAL